MGEEKGSSPPELTRQIMIQYLLEELPSAWQEHFEAQFFTDKESFEQLKLVEDQLVDDYVSQVLPEPQRLRFENHYLNSDRRRQKLKFAQTLKKSLAELTPLSTRPTPWQSFVAAWQTPVLRYACAALAVLGIVAGGWLLQKSLRLQQQLQQLESERATLTKPPASPLPGITPTIPPQTPVTEKQIPAPTISPATKSAQNEARANTILSVVLSPGTFRDDQATAKTFIVTPQTKAIRLQLPLASQEQYAAYRVVLETASGQTIKTQTNLRPIKIGKSNFLVLSLPAQALPANDYLLTLAGKNDDVYEEIEDYQFRIVTRP